VANKFDLIWFEN